MRTAGLVATVLAAGATALPHVEPSNFPAEAVQGHLKERQDTCSGPTPGSPSTWWRAAIEHNGTTPYSSDDTFQYYRTAVQYGADPSGKNDSSEAFNFAITAWSRTGNTVTTRPAYIYVEPGTYRISSSIQMLVSTFLVGDALNPPTLVADASLGEHPVINGYDSHQGDGSATKNFYMTVRNINIDTTAIDVNTAAHGMDWSVSQGCDLRNVHIKMPNNSKHIGVSMASGGSGIIISDSTFEGGSRGIELSNQQYIFKNLSFNACNVGIYIKSVFVATFQGITFQNCNYGIDMGRDGAAGAVSLVDSSISTCNAGVNAHVSGNGEGGLTIDNFQVADDGTKAVLSSDGSTLLAGSVPVGQTWVMGNESPQNYQSGRTYPINRPAALQSGDKYVTVQMPQYEEYDLDQFVSIKGDPEFTVYGDNDHDDGAAINGLLKKYGGCKILFFPQGIYKTSETVYVPAGSHLVGEAHSVISGTGDLFSNADDPQPIVKVGEKGEIGVAQFTDLLFSTADILPGAIIVQVNMAGAQPGDVGFWNSIIRVGGSIDSLVSTNCGDADPSGCKAAFALLHVTDSASAYFEDVWGWVADHGLDPNTAAQNIAVGRGALIESTKPTWLVGTSFEHCVLYQYSLNKASNVYIGLQQTENPYWQGEGTPQRAPAPWTADPAFSDPDFSNCAAQGAADNDRCYRAWGHHMADSHDVVIHGSALWVFFNKMNDNKWQDAGCDATGGVCQLNMAFVDGANSTFWYTLSSKSTTNLVYDATGGSVALTAQENNPGSWGAVVSAYLRDSGVPEAQ